MSCEVSWERVRVPYGVVVELHALGDVLARAARQLLRVHQSETARRSKFVLDSARSTVGSDARAHTERERASPGPRAPRRAFALARPSPHRHYPQARRALQGQCRSLCHHQTRPTATVGHSFHAFHRHRPAPRVSPVHVDTTAQSSCRAGLIPADTLERPVEFSLASPARARALQGRVHSLTSLARVTDYQGVQESTRARRVQGAARLVGRQARHYRAPSRAGGPEAQGRAPPRRDGDTERERERGYGSDGTTALNACQAESERRWTPGDADSRGRDVHVRPSARLVPHLPRPVPRAIPALRPAALLAPSTADAALPPAAAVPVNVRPVPTNRVHLCAPTPRAPVTVPRPAVGTATVRAGHAATRESSGVPKRSLLDRLESLARRTRGELQSATFSAQGDA